MTSAPPLEFLQPLPLFYTAAARPLPDIEVVEPSALPPAAMRLLVHSGDMTSKLEDFFADEMLLRVIQREHTAQHYRREVLLQCAQSGLPVEYGAIEISLDAFEEPLCGEILTARVPLGALLNRHAIRYRSEPRAFLRVNPCPYLAPLFQLTAPATLYGRSNQLLDERNRVLAQIVEILRPV